MRYRVTLLLDMPAGERPEQLIDTKLNQAVDAGDLEHFDYIGCEKV